MMLIIIDLRLHTDPRRHRRLLRHFAAHWNTNESQLSRICICIGPEHTNHYHCISRAAMSRVYITLFATNATQQERTKKREQMHS